MNYRKWTDWRLIALNGIHLDDTKEQQVDETKINDDDYILIKESFYHLNTEAKLGLALRQVNKHLNEIDKQYQRACESKRMDEAMVENWTKTYRSLKSLDEKLHGLMERMRSGK